MSKDLSPKKPTFKKTSVKKTASKKIPKPAIQSKVIMKSSRLGGLLSKVKAKFKKWTG